MVSFSFKTKCFYVLDEHGYKRATPGLDEALRAVRGSSSSGTRQRPQSAYHMYPSTPAPASTRPHPHSASPAARTNPSSASSRPVSGHKPPLSPSHKLRDGSLHNLTNSRTLFEKQLEHHQRLLMEEQQTSLHHFNEAILREMEEDKKLRGEEEVQDPNAVETESVSSADSLEESTVINPRVDTAPALVANNIVNNLNNPGEGFDGLRTANTSNIAATSGFVLHRNTSPNVAIVQPMSNNSSSYALAGSSKLTCAGPGELQLEDVQEDEAALQGSNTSIEQTTDAYATIKTDSNGRTNGQFYQDIIVNNVHGTEPSSQLYYHGAGTSVSPYDHKAYTDERPKNSWGAHDSNTHDSQVQTNSHMTTNAKPFTSRQTLTNTTVITHDADFTNPQSQLYSNKPSVVVSDSMIAPLSNGTTSAKASAVAPSTSSTPISPNVQSMQYNYPVSGSETTINAISKAPTATTKSIFPNSVVAASDNLLNHFGMTPPSNAESLHSGTSPSASKPVASVSNPIPVMIPRPAGTQAYSQPVTKTKETPTDSASAKSHGYPVPTTAITLVQQKPSVAYQQSTVSQQSSAPVHKTVAVCSAIEDKDLPNTSSHMIAPVTTSELSTVYKQTPVATTMSQQPTTLNRLSSSTTSQPNSVYRQNAVAAAIQQLGTTITTYRQNHALVTTASQQPTTTTHQQNSVVTTAFPEPLTTYKQQEQATTSNQLASALSAVQQQSTTVERKTSVNQNITASQPQKVATTATSNRQTMNKPPPYCTATTTTTNSTYYSYKVAPRVSSRSKSAPTSKKDIPVVHDAEEEQEEEESSSNSEEEKFAVKSILKRRGRSNTPKKSVRIGGVIGKGSNRSLAASVRDSIEVNREKQEQKEQKKVRVSSLLYFISFSL